MRTKRSLEHYQQIVIALAEGREGFAVKGCCIAIRRDVALPRTLDQTRDLRFLLLVRDLSLQLFHQCGIDGELRV